MFDHLSPEVKAAVIGVLVVACFVLRDMIVAWGKRQVSKAHTEVTRDELDVKTETFKLQAVQMILDSERHLRTLIDELNTDLGIKTENLIAVTQENKKLAEQQRLNVDKITTLQSEFNVYRKDRHDHDIQLSTKLADSELRALHAEKSLADCIERSNKLIAMLGDKAPPDLLSTGIADQQ